MLRHESSLFYKPITWLFLIIAAVAAVAITLYYYPQANDLIAIDISMNKVQAERAAQGIAQRYHLGPTDHYTATIFILDQAARNYVELEAGGKKEFERMLHDHLYEAYTWQVRHFKPHETNEALYIFTSNGKPYGFKEKIAETTKGAALSGEQARIIVEKGITDWHISLSLYHLIESSQEQQPSGRVDHTFVYERINETRGEGRYRLKVMVSGDKLTMVQHVFNVPDSFTRRYQEMRSANEGIAHAASGLMWLLYFFIGCFIGIILLLRSGYVLIYPALWWGIGLAFLRATIQGNYFPLILFAEYTTNLSFANFMLSQIALFIKSFIAQTFLYSITIIAAESLTRRAFGDQLQLWKSWSLPVASSASVLGATLGGYLIVPFLLCYETLIFISGNYWFGWWSPSETLADPNILATYIPSFSPIVNALGAGLWEECLFRALPLAGAALIGRWLGKERLLLAITFILQAFIFNAAHANYPCQPSYVRIIELLPISATFGWLYLSFGLIPAIISHWIYDLVLMAIPLFVSTAPGIVLQRCLIIISALVPLLILLIQKVRSSSPFLHRVPLQYYNKAWRPDKHLAEQEESLVHHIPLTRKTRFTVVLGGCIALCLWLFLIPKQQDVPVIALSKQQALSSTRAYLQRMHIVLGSSWTEIASLCSPEHEVLYGFTKSPLSPPHNEEAHRFVWGIDKELYHKLLGTFLTPPCWLIRYAQFEGNLIERAEEYVFLVDKYGTIQRMKHILPESRPQASLDEQQARIIAHQALIDYFHVSPTTVEELSACSQQRLARRDWTFTFFDPAWPQLPPKTARFSIHIAGSSIIDAYRYIHVPEERLRSEHQRLIINESLTSIIIICMFAFFVLGAIFALSQWTRHRFSIKALFIITGGWLVLTMLQFYNNSALLMTMVQTNQPLFTQLFILISQYIFPIGIFAAPIIGIIFAYVLYRRKISLNSLSWHICLGASLSMIYLAIMQCIHFYIPPLAPYILSSDTLATRWLWLGFAPQKVMHLTIMLAGTLLFCTILNELVRAKRYVIAFAVILFSGFMIIKLSPTLPLTWWFISSLVTSFYAGSVYWVFLSRDYSYAPFMLTTLYVARLAHQTYTNNFPGSFTSAVVTSILLISLALVWTRIMQKRSTKQSI
jgi:hypothetical protein